MGNSWECRCAHFPDEDGRPLPQAWVAAHDEVRVVGRDGRVATGWTSGLDVASTPGGPELFLDVEVAGDESVIFTVDEIVACTPLAGLVDAEEFLNEVRAAVMHVIHTTDDQLQYIKFILSGHSEVEVTVQYAALRCRPTTHD